MPAPVGGTWRKRKPPQQDCEAENHRSSTVKQKKKLQQRSTIIRICVCTYKLHTTIDTTTCPIRRRARMYVICLQSEYLAHSAAQNSGTHRGLACDGMCYALCILRVRIKPLITCSVSPFALATKCLPRLNGEFRPSIGRAKPPVQQGRKRCAQSYLPP